MAPSIGQEAIGSELLSLAHPNAFQNLVYELSSILGPSSGLDSSEINVQQLLSLMEGYTSNQKDWNRFAFSDFSRGYTRNLVDEGNGKSNLLVLVWTPGKGSPIHDHADAHCLMKVLRGSLKETRFSILDSDMPLQSTKEIVFKENEVTYMSDELGLHRISNPDLNNSAVSLHLYTPPNAAREGCNIFDETTGRSSHVTQSNFYSIYGRKL